MQFPEKRGQMTIFIVIALIIIAVVLVIFLYPGFKGAISGSAQSPQNFMVSCIKPTLDSSMVSLDKQGGYANPEGYVLYNGNKVKYLCYTSDYYKTCVVQQPMVKDHYQKELNDLVNAKATSCFNELKNEYQKQGYTVNSGNPNVNLTIGLHAININFNLDLTLTKDKATQNYNDFSVSIPSQIYTSLFIAQSIVNYESTYGNSETSLYINYYPNIRIYKNYAADGQSKVYTIENVITDENFTFASRSLAWPPGYGGV